MPQFDHSFVDEVVARLRGLHPDARPRWGTFTAPGMIDHLCRTVRYGLGRSGRVEDQSNWFTRRLLKPLVVRGLVPIPRNVKAPDSFLEGPVPEGDVETLHALLEEYLAKVQAGDLEPPDHPVFGAMTVDDWARLNVLHIEHHLRQFAV